MYPGRRTHTRITMPLIFEPLLERKKYEGYLCRILHSPVKCYALYKQSSLQRILTGPRNLFKFQNNIQEEVERTLNFLDRETPPFLRNIISEYKDPTGRTENASASMQHTLTLRSLQIWNSRK